MCYIPDTFILFIYHYCQNSRQGLQVDESFNHFCLGISASLLILRKMYLLFEKLSKQKAIFVPQHRA